MSSPERDDAELLREVAAEDRDAFEILYRRYYRRVFAFVLKVTRRPDLAEEVVDDVLLAVWRNAGRFEGRSRPSTWIFGIAYRRALKALKALEAGGPETAPMSAEHVSSRPGPERRVARREVGELLARALGVLSPEQRAVVELTYLYGYSYPEIAQIVDCPVGTVKTRMFHARRRLRAELEALGVEGDELDRR